MAARQGETLPTGCQPTLGRLVSSRRKSGAVGSEGLYPVARTPNSDSPGGASGKRERELSGEATQRLLRRASLGDEDALQLLYKRYRGPLRRWAHARLPVWARDGSETEDLVQEVLARSLAIVRNFDPEHSGAFQAYLRTSVQNQIKDQMRKVARQPTRHGLVGEFADRRQVSPVQEVIGREALERYEQALETLKPTDRGPLLARIEMGLPFAEIAREFGKTSVDAARMTVRRALLKLAKEMAHGR